MLPLTLPVFSSLLVRIVLSSSSPKSLAGRLACLCMFCLQLAAANDFFLLINLLIVFLFDHLVYKMSDNSEKCLKTPSDFIKSLAISDNTTLILNSLFRNTRRAVNPQDREAKTRSCLVSYP